MTTRKKVVLLSQQTENIIFNYRTINIKFRKCETKNEE